MEPDTLALHISLLLNLSVTALKMAEWRLARAACESVLSVEPVNSTALWRLAKAHEGGNNLSEAIVAASKLARSDASHAEAHRLLDRLQQRTAQYGKMFS